MTEKISFTSNFTDLSTNQGFQFEFHCDRCHSGFRTKFKPSLTGTVSGALNMLGGIFGGVLGQAGNVGEQVRNAGWKQAWEEAFREAAQEAAPDFFQCPRCQAWVCRAKCYNEKKGLCKNCAPDLGVEMAAAQAQRSVEEIHAHAAMAEEDKKLGEENWRQTIRANCAKCEKPLGTNAKFCPECGEPVKTTHTCPHCQAEFTAKSKFCPECGKKL